MRGKGVLFGLNYAHCKKGKLNGCINDVSNMSKYIQQKLHIPIDIYTDDVDTINTSHKGIINVLYKLAQETFTFDLDFVWIHYSGHGSNTKDISGDEADGMDEGLVPSDYESSGLIIDDILHKILAKFNPNTQILFICDACHSGSILDLKYVWDTERTCKIDNSISLIPSKTILISGCMDEQTSADAFNAMGDGKYVGALSASILKILLKKPEKIYNAFSFLNSIRKDLSNSGYKQFPCLTTNFDISDSCSLIPSMIYKKPTYSNHQHSEHSANQNNHQPGYHQRIQTQPCFQYVQPRINKLLPYSVMKQNNTHISPILKNNNGVQKKNMTFVGYYL